MSKRKIDETMTAARNARRKKDREADEKPVELLITKDGIQKVSDDAKPEAQETPATETAGKKASRKGRAAQAAPVAPTEATKSDDGLCVFAFRLKPEERDAIHKAAGAAKASKFARALLVAASKGDVKLVSEITQAVRDQVSS